MIKKLKEIKERWNDYSKLIIDYLEEQNESHVQGGVTISYPFLNRVMFALMGKMRIRFNLKKGSWIMLDMKNKKPRLNIMMISFLKNNEHNYGIWDSYLFGIGKNNFKKHNVWGKLETDWNITKEGKDWFCLEESFKMIFKVDLKSKKSLKKGAILIKDDLWFELYSYKKEVK